MKTYLALGDSYTIGEQVLLEENFPNQTFLIINQTANGAESRRRGFSQTPSAVENPDGGLIKFNSPKIIATTGWTTDELDTAINEENITTTFDLVTLLIGVNNQYRGRSVANFKIEFEHLLQRAIQFANNIPNHVIVLSIPDWGVTPFAADRDTKQIAKEIDAYNLMCEKGAQHFKTHFIDITTAQRMNGAKEDFLATDKLHPSGKEYKKWAEKVAFKIQEIYK
jgi:lysophospholipase L1-like esterase